MPAAAVIRVVQALSGIIGRKGYVGGNVSRLFNPKAQPLVRNRNGTARGWQGCMELME